MTIIQPVPSSQGGSIHLKYAPGATVGISNSVRLSFSLRITPATQQPRVLVALQLPAGDFRFNNNSLTLTRDVGYRADGDEVQIDFQIVCNVAAPNTGFYMDVSTQDAATGSQRTMTLHFTVKQLRTTLSDVKATFLNP